MYRVAGWIVYVFIPLTLFVSQKLHFYLLSAEAYYKMGKVIIVNEDVRGFKKESQVALY